MEDRFKGCLLGLACGDAVGTSVEFKPRGTFVPVSDMTGGGPFSLQAGEWTDDTSMALCLAESLLERRGFDPRDQMERYCRWQSEGYLSSNGRIAHYQSIAETGHIQIPLDTLKADDLPRRINESDTMCPDAGPQRGEITLYGLELLLGKSDGFLSLFCFLEGIHYTLSELLDREGLG